MTTSSPDPQPSDDRQKQLQPSVNGVDKAKKTAPFLPHYSFSLLPPGKKPEQTPAVTPALHWLSPSIN